MSEAQDAHAASVLFICTGNIYRSVFGAKLFQAALGTQAQDVKVCSAGIGSSGRPPKKDAIKVMGKRGIDISDHLSTHFPRRLNPPPDLIIGMTQQHQRELVDHDLSLFPRTFSLKEFVRLAQQAGPRRPEQSVTDYINEVGAGRELTQLARLSFEDDVADPIGAGGRAVKACAEEIDGLVSEMAALLFPRTLS